MNDAVITIDVDWAPDFAIEEVADILVRSQTKATWFITHDSDATRALFDRSDLFEVGLHPNFLKGSTQGSSPKEIMRNLKTIVPDAVSVRTHGLVQSTNLLQMLVEEFGIRNDTSLLLPRVVGIVPHRLYFKEDLHLTRLPHFWQDDMEALRPEPSYSLEDDFHHRPGLKIYDFHPIHIMLNTADLVGYRHLRINFGPFQYSRSDVEKLKYIHRGVEVFFRELVSNMSGGHTVKEVAGRWNEGVGKK